MIRHVLALCTLLIPAVAAAQTPSSSGVPIVFFSIFGPNGSTLQRFYADVFDWTPSTSGDVAVPVTTPLMGNVGEGAAETLIYIGVPDVTATLKKVVERGGAIRHPRFEVPGRVVLGLFRDPAGNSVGLVEMENGKAKVPK